MRIAALYDVHGNLPALNAVLAEVETLGVEGIVVGGDVAAGPMPVETLDALRARGAHFIRGNADRGPWTRSDRRWVASRLGEERLAFLAALPLDLTLELAGVGSVRFCHGAPGSDEAPITRLTPEARLRELLQGVTERVVVCGHTHLQFDRTIDGIRVVNAGSVGAPYEAEPGAYWAVLGPDIELHRSAYDLEAAISAIMATGYPGADGVVSYLRPDPERPARISALIEGRR